MPAENAVDLIFFDDCDVTVGVSRARLPAGSVSEPCWWMIVLVRLCGRSRCFSCAFASVDNNNNTENMDIQFGNRGYIK
jgi:hypothetical protein